MRIFLDANILFSASDEKSATRCLLKQICCQAKLLTNRHAWEEARRNIEAKRPYLLSGFSELEQCVQISAAFQMPQDVDLADKDKPILAGAVGAECTHLWTSDRTHFGDLYGKEIEGVTIVSSIMLSDILGK